MKLSEKGRFRPPPVLEGPAQSVSQAVQSWPNIIAATHWFLFDRRHVDGADFYVGEEELGHIHLDGEIHLSLTPDLAAFLVEHRVANPFQWDDGWVAYRVRTQREAQHGEWLMRLGYDRINGTATPALKRRIKSRAMQPA